MARTVWLQWAWRVLKIGLRAGAVILAVWGLFLAWVAINFFHIDTRDELRFVLGAFEASGQLLALAVILWRIPSPGGSTWRRHAVTIVIALAIYLFVARCLRNERLEAEAGRAGMTPSELLESVR
jgi:hypothetical protein